MAASNGATKGELRYDLIRRPRSPTNFRVKSIDSAVFSILAGAENYRFCLFKEILRQSN
jgi:hypothetical protein